MKITDLETAPTNVRPDGVAMTEFFAAAEGAKVTMGPRISRRGTVVPWAAHDADEYAILSGSVSCETEEDGVLHMTAGGGEFHPRRPAASPAATTAQARPSSSGRSSKKITVKAKEAGGSRTGPRSSLPPSLAEFRGRSREIKSIIFGGGVRRRKYSRGAECRNCPPLADNRGALAQRSLCRRRLRLLRQADRVPDGTPAVFCSYQPPLARMEKCM